MRKDILFLRCQACGQRQTSRTDTPVRGLKTPLEQVRLVVMALAEGLDLSAASRIFRHHPTTIARWVERCGVHGARLHEQVLFRVIQAGHVQLDELVIRVKNKTDRVFVWTAIAAHSKLVLGLHIGGRTLAEACTLVHQVMRTLAPGCLPVFTSDGLNHYFYALTAHFGYWDKPPKARKHHWFPDPALLYGQLIKARSGYKLRFISSIIRLGERAAFRARLLAQGLSGKVQTSAIERHNLTLRELVAPLSRRTWSMAHDILHLWLHTLWGITYYNFIRVNMALEVQIRGPGKHRLRTPAMAVGLTRRPWSVSDFLLLPLPRRAWLSPLRIA